jgi:hypothetical protein
VNEKRKLKFWPNPFFKTTDASVTNSEHSSATNSEHSSATSSEHSSATNSEHSSATNSVTHRCQLQQTEASEPLHDEQLFDFVTNYACVCPNDFLRLFGLTMLLIYL